MIEIANLYYEAIVQDNGTVAPLQMIVREGKMAALLPMTVPVKRCGYFQHT
jgi:hypothetical protein